MVKRFIDGDKAYEALKIVEEYFLENRHEFNRHEQILIEQTFLSLGSNMIVKDLHEWVGENRDDA